MTECKRCYLQGFIYVMSAGPFVKIGHSMQPESRLIEIQTGCPLKVRLTHFTPGSPTNEREIHYCLKAAGLQENGEWYKRAKVRAVVMALAQNNVALAVAKAAQLFKARVPRRESA